MIGQILELWKTSLFFRIAAIIAVVGALMLVLSPRSGTTAVPMAASSPSAPPATPPSTSGPSWPGSPARPAGMIDKAGRILDDSVSLGGDVIDVGKRGAKAAGAIVDRVTGR